MSPKQVVITFLIDCSARYKSNLLDTSTGLENTNIDSTFDED
jgi:hypothetical protein